MHLHKAYMNADETARRFVFLLDRDRRCHVVVKHFICDDVWSVKIWLTPFLGPEAHHWSTNLPFEPSREDVIAAFRAFDRARSAVDFETLRAKDDNKVIAWW